MFMFLAKIQFLMYFYLQAVPLTELNYKNTYCILYICAIYSRANNTCKPGCNGFNLFQKMENPDQRWKQNDFKTYLSKFVKELIWLQIISLSNNTESYADFELSKKFQKSCKKVCSGKLLLAENEGICEVLFFISYYREQKFWACTFLRDRFCHFLKKDNDYVPNLRLQYDNRTEFSTIVDNSFKVL